MRERHLTDQELIRAADGELSAAEAARAQKHIAACSPCRMRKDDLETALAQFAAVQTREPIPPAAHARALLRQRIARMPEPAWTDAIWRPAAAICVAIIAVITIFVVRHVSDRRVAHVASVSVPNPMLTPGVTVLLSKGEVCEATAPKNKTVPAALQRKVFDEYGMTAADPKFYEVDYLITPALGGADDIRNLWPQSNTATDWNAQVKDALEDRMRELVCQGQLDLATAQREIATDWIHAYKKYFHTDRPLIRSSN